MMKRLLFTILALCVLCMGLQAQNTNTTNQKGVTATGQLDTVRNTRMNPTTQNEQIQSKFVDPFGKTGQRPGLSPYGQRLKAVIKVTSSSINSVSGSTATIAATVSDSGDYALPIIERGVCYATTANPTLLTATATKVPDATISGKGFGNFNVSLSGLNPNTEYHARAYAVSLYDTVYGEDLTFTILVAGALPGKFTINSDGDQVYFSQGNLRATNTTANSTSGWTWSFAEHQWDYIGNATANTAVYTKGTVYTSGTVDLFGWSTANTAFGIWNSTTTGFYSGDFVDWGSNIGIGWRTLTGGESGEWMYLFGLKSNSNSCEDDADNTKRYLKAGHATVAGVNGIILVPDNFIDPMKNGGSGAFVGGISTTSASNVYTAGTNWDAMEAAGCVFLPFAYHRRGSLVYSEYSLYWSSTSYTTDMSYNVKFTSSTLDAKEYYNKNLGCSVRLVLDAN